MQDLVALWRSPQWLAEADDWVCRELASRGVRTSGPLAESRMRFWSAVFTVDTDRGRHWFKVANPGQGFEARLTSTLAGLVPEHVVAPVAVDTGRAWILTPDQGPTLREAAAGSPDHWEPLVRGVARMQRSLVAHESEVVGAGVTPFAAADAAAYVLAAMDELEHLPAGHPQLVTAEVADRVRATAPQLQEDAEVLDATGLPDTLQHNDLGDSNAFLDGGRVRIFDLGDSLWSHPLPVMQVPLAVATGSWPIPGVEDPKVRRLLVAYLSEWSDEPESLLGAWPAALRLAGVHRFASWARLAAEVPPDVVGEDLRLVDYLDPKAD